MSFGAKLKNAMKAGAVKEADLAVDVHYSRQAISAWANERRRVPGDVLPKLSNRFDDPDLMMEIGVLATNGVSLPPLDGDYIRQDTLAMIDLAMKETQEAMDKLAKAQLYKPPEYATDRDKQEVQSINEEVLEAACSMVNLVRVNCREYGLSFRNMFHRLEVTLKARRMRK
ncbi:helix-turn-helix domain-containing protein [Sporolactobacillus terrae]|uniref:helix-turn-helix domain-containing protein n=1 Tax=Sporolactobacillus terrae TaxID=269673 RepID=UPI00048DA07C|nr:helix-turn-helix transcriptional regulator [Sporolactobacillus terrae]